MNQRTFGALALVAAAAMALPATASTLYFQGFEDDTDDWSANAERVASGTDGITSAAGDFHARAQEGTAFHFFGTGATVASSASIPFSASIDFFLDLEGGWDNDTRFSYTVSLLRPDTILPAGFRLQPRLLRR